MVRMKLVGLIVLVSFIFVLSFLVMSMVLSFFGLPLDTGTFATVATVELAFVAVFEERIHHWLRKPKLEIEIRLESPDCHQTIWAPTLGGVASSHSYLVYYYRFKVWNKGQISSEKVEVMLTKVYSEKDGKFERDKTFPQDNLNWGSIFKDGRPIIHYNNISPGTCKLCVLGHVWNPRFREEDPYGTLPFSVEPAESVFCFDVSFVSNLKYFYRRKGTYGIELQACTQTQHR